MQASPKVSVNLEAAMAISLTLIASVVLAAALVYAKSIMIPFVLALFISFSIIPLIQFLRERLKLPYVAAVFLTLAIVLGVFGLIGLLVASNIRTFVGNVDSYKSQLLITVEHAVDYLQTWGFPLKKDNITEYIYKMPIFPYVGNVASKVFSISVDALLVLTFVVFMLTGRETELPKSGIWERISRDTRVYLWTKFVTSFATGLLTALALLIFGLPMAFMFGVLAFLLNYIPTIGAAVSILLPAPVAILHFQNPWLAGACVAVPGAIQFILGSAVEPKYVGDALDLHPVTVLLALMFWGLLWGIPGMILATPFCVILRICLDQFSQTQRLAKLMSGRIQEALQNAPIVTGSN